MSFKNPGNERSYKCNFEVLDKLQHAVTATAVEEKDLLLYEAFELLEGRNRKIRFADSSEAGWLTNKHYENNSAVALSSEDDKKIRVAEMEAR